MRKFIVFVFVLAIVLGFKAPVMASNHDNYVLELNTDRIPWANENNFLTGYKLLTNHPLMSEKSAWGRVFDAGLDLGAAYVVSIVGHEYGGHGNACLTKSETTFSLSGGQTMCDIPVPTTVCGFDANGKSFCNTTTPKITDEWDSIGAAIDYAAGLNFQKSLADKAIGEKVGKAYPAQSAIFHALNSLTLLRYTARTVRPSNNNFENESNEGYDPALYVSTLPNLSQHQQDKLYNELLIGGIWQGLGTWMDFQNIFEYLASGKNIALPRTLVQPGTTLSPYGVEFDLEAMTLDAPLFKGRLVQATVGAGQSFDNRAKDLKRVKVEIDDLPIFGLKASPKLEWYTNSAEGFVFGLELRKQLTKVIGVGLKTELKPTAGWSPSFYTTDRAFRAGVETIVRF